MQSDKFFIGYEAEGRFKGVPTLFVRGFHKEAWATATEYGLNHIYFGAGKEFCLGGAMDDLAMFVVLNQLRVKGVCRSFLTLEHPLKRVDEIPAIVWEASRVILSHDVPVPHALLRDTEIKLENASTALVYGNPQVIDLSYVHDRPLSGKT
jgi:hypothetical protein